MTLTKWARPGVVLLIVLGLLLSPFTVAAQSGGPGSDRDADAKKVSPELRSLLASNARGAIPVIVQMDAGGGSAPGTGRKPEDDAKEKIERHGGAASKSLGIIRGAGGEVSLDRLAALSREPGVRYVSYDSVLVPMGSPFTGDMVDFAAALNADEVWEKGILGSGVTAAVLDSGVEPGPHGVDPRRVVASVDLVNATKKTPDPGGHGTHVAGIIAGQDTAWSGIAPRANIVSVRVTNDKGVARKSTVIRGIQWAVQNRKAYGIRILNISLGAPATTSYTQDPLAAAVELAWHAGLVVVASAGNGGPAAKTISTPGYDPFVVTVGAVDMNGTQDKKDDIPAFFSSRGPTIDGLAKPDVVAPGRKMVSTRVVGSYLDQLYPDRVVNNYYFRLSGTSQAAAAVSGVAALMLSANPRLTPDQVKQGLMASASKMNGYDANAVGAGHVDASKAVKGESNESRSDGSRSDSSRSDESRSDKSKSERSKSGKSKLGDQSQSARPADAFALLVLPLIKGNSPLVWKDLKYNGGVDSQGILWKNVTWDNVTWDNVTWDNLAWDNVAWDNVAWDNLAWDNVAWDNVAWDNVAWDNPKWDNVSWDNLAWDNLAWDNLAWDNLAWDNLAWDTVGRLD